MMIMIIIIIKQITVFISVYLLLIFATITTPTHLRCRDS